jgi:hypothetical protein
MQGPEQPEVEESALEQMGTIVATALGRYLDVALASGRGINTFVLQELQRARLPSRPGAAVQDDEHRVDCLLDELCAQHREDLRKVGSRSNEALAALQTQKHELLSRVLAIEERHAALDSLDLPAIEAALTCSHSLVVSMQAREEDLAFQLAYKDEQRAAAVDEVRYSLPAPAHAASPLCALLSARAARFRLSLCPASLAFNA